MGNSMSENGVQPLEALERWDSAPCVTYIADRETLIAAGVVKPGQFPGEPGCGKTSTVFPGAGERKKTRVYVVSLRNRKPFRFGVDVYRTPEERAAYIERAQFEFQDRQRAQRVAQDRDRLAQCGGARGVAEDALKAGILSLVQAFNLTNDPHHPYAFDEATTAKANALLAEIAQLFGGGGFSARLGAFAQSDPEFQRFVGQALGSAAEGGVFGAYQREADGG